jgi:LPS export ABC transporter protein LptC
MLICISCENDIAKVKGLSERKIIPNETAKGVTILYSDSGNVIARLETPLLTRIVQTRKMMLMPDGVKLTFFDADGKVSSTLTSKKARIFDLPDNQIMEAERDVVVVNEEGDRLNTERLVWDQKSAEITSNAFVKVTRKDEVITGTGLKANQDFSKYRITKISGILKVKQ